MRRCLPRTTLAQRLAGQLVQVEARHFVAGLIVGVEGDCIAAAPILRWAVGKRWLWLDGYLRGRGYGVRLL